MEYSTVAYISALVGMVLFFAGFEYIRHIIAGRKHIAFLRDSGRWAFSRGTARYDPYIVLSDLIYSLNLGGNLRPYEETYSRAWIVGATTEEVWRIHFQVHRWRVEQKMKAFRNGEYICSFDDLGYDLEKAQCTLAELEITEAEFADLQKKILLEDVRYKIREYQKTGDVMYLMSLRPSFEDADMEPRIYFSEVEAVAKESNLDYTGLFTINFAAGEFVARPKGVKS